MHKHIDTLPSSGIRAGSKSSRLLECAAKVGANAVLRG